MGGKKLFVRLTLVFFLAAACIAIALLVSWQIMLVFIFGSLLLVFLLFIIAILWAFRRCAPLQERVQLTSDVTVVKDFIVSFAVVNLSPNEVLLVDAAFSPAAIEKELSRRNLSNDAVKAILLTHGHHDHFGGAHAFPHAQIYALDKELSLLKGEADAESLVSYLMPAQSDSGIRPTHLLHDNDSFTIGSVNVRVFACPGHTDGSAVYLIRDVLFFGDSAESAADGQHFYPAKWIPSNNAFQNQAALAALCDRLTHAGSDKQIVHLVFGHSAPLSRGLAPFVEWSQGFQQQSLRQ